MDGYDGIYTALDESPSDRWQVSGDDRGESAAPAPEPGPEAAELGKGSTFAQARALSERYVKLLLRDHKNLALLIGQAPILALAQVGLFQPGILDRPGGNPADAIQVLFLAVITIVWVGSTGSVREVVRERGVLQRERAIGVRLSAYLISKVGVLFALMVLQTLLYAGLLFAFRPLGADAVVWVQVFGLLMLTGFVSVAMGLVLSAVAGSEDQAMSLVPLVVIPQLLFAGSIVPVARMAEPAQTLSYAIPSQWSLAGVGSAVDMNGRIAEAPQGGGAEQFGTGFFDAGVATPALVLAGFLTLFLGVLTLMLRERRA